MRIYNLFADILDYPNPRLMDSVDQCIPLAASLNRGADELLRKFKAGCERAGGNSLEEIYTGTFDMKAGSSPYVGYHLFGDDWRRSAFLAKLQERFRAGGFSARQELPDHISVMLRFLASQDTTPETAELVDVCVVPALRKMTGSILCTANPYAPALQALLLCLDCHAVEELEPKTDADERK